MATFVLLAGASSDSWYWHLVAPILSDAGHDVLAVDLPIDDDACGLTEYAETVIDAIGDRRGVVIVAQSMAAYTTGLVAAKRPVDLIILVAAMTPAPDESPGTWWANTGQPEAASALAIEEGRDPAAAFDPVEIFLHDVPADVAAESEAHVIRQSDTPFGQPWPLAAWPEVPTWFILGQRDRLFPADFQRRIVPERLGIVPDEIDTGHLPALANPKELARMLLGYFDRA